MIQWRSWIRSRFSTSISLSSASRRRRQDQGRTQEEINQRLSLHYLQVSTIMSYVLFYSLFCGSVIYSLHPSDQSSVQKSSAQPFVTEAVFDSTSESDYSASLVSFASLKPITSAIMAIGISIQGSSRCSGCVSRSSLRSRRCDDAVSRSYLDRQQSGSRTIGCCSCQDGDCNVKSHNQQSLST